MTLDDIAKRLDDSFFNSELGDGFKNMVSEVQKMILEARIEEIGMLPYNRDANSDNNLNYFIYMKYLNDRINHLQKELEGLDETT